MLEPNFDPFPEIQTERLLLRRLTQNDSEEIFSLRSNADTMKYIGKPLAASLSEAIKFIGSVNESLMNNNGILWAIELKEFPGKLVGYIGHWRLIKEHYRAEVGYMLLPDYWRKGIMKEALNVVINYGFKEMKLHSIEAHINPDNKASSGLLECAGFIREAYFKEDFFSNGAFGDTAIYSKLTHIR